MARSTGNTLTSPFRTQLESVLYIIFNSHGRYVNPCQKFLREMYQINNIIPRYKVSPMNSCQNSAPVAWHKTLNFVVQRHFAGRCVVGSRNR